MLALRETDAVISLRSVQKTNAPAGAFVGDRRMTDQSTEKFCRLTGVVPAVVVMLSQP